MGTKNNPGEFNCYANALPDEPMFILLARDPHAPRFIGEWAVQRMLDVIEDKRPQSDINLVEEAIQIAKKMHLWRKEHNGEWRKPKAVG